MSIQYTTVFASRRKTRKTGTTYIPRTGQLTLTTIVFYYTCDGSYHCCKYLFFIIRLQKLWPLAVKYISHSRVRYDGFLKHVFSYVGHGFIAKNLGGHLSERDPINTGRCLTIAPRSDCSQTLQPHYNLAHVFGFISYSHLNNGSPVTVKIDSKTSRPQIVSAKWSNF